MQAQHEAFLAFMQPYARIIKHTIWRVCGERYPALQADIEQEVYLTLWAQWTNERCIDSPISYMYSNRSAKFNCTLFELTVSET